ncbi:MULTISPECIES: DUF4429 domain-containing protein [Microbacterium]|uniref:DUF4429 domain-containing protein n=1 Tax=Microbacterium phage vB_MoxS-R1 TaxID=2848881 RepID=A0A8F2E5I2_9CAUD|nr:DUF4429 domain-containing protein [Microbacterium sp. R1]YP_010649937.1 hypothetical protein PP419_gp56 [Microbacterium phage vB_MoxS-R1]MBE7953621.1 DUF4429 domain-containing protein [Microbacterium sp. R1]QWT28907.1 hypothetical protein vBMoxSR1_gp57 [Microbacterium phage vB_MoxS-R1]
MAEVIAAQGRNGHVSFDGKTVTITREGFAARISHGRGEKSIPLRQIAAVQMKPVSLMTTGFIQFTVPGEISSKTQKGGRGLDAAADENAVLFLKKQEPEFIALGAAIKSALAEL